MKIKSENKKFEILIISTIILAVYANHEEVTYFTSCVNALRSRYTNGTGIYTILVGGDPILVMCDDDVYGGNWLVFQRRVLGDVNFHRSFKEYKLGFGTFQGDFWLGLDPLYQILTQSRHELILAMENWQNKKFFAKYDNFQMETEKHRFKITSLGVFTGTVERDAFRKHLGAPFSVDNYCANRYKAGWWWTNCYSANLNGIYPYAYFKDATSAKKIMNWVTYNLHEPLRFVQMMIRPTTRNSVEAIRSRTNNTMEE